MASTHFAVSNGQTIIGTRSSTSRHAEGTGKFGPYLYAVVVTYRISTFHQSAADTHTYRQEVISWHGSFRTALVASQKKELYRKYNLDANGYAIGSWEPNAPVFGVRQTERVEVVPVVIVPKRVKVGDQAQFFAYPAEGGAL